MDNASNPIEEQVLLAGYLASHDVPCPHCEHNLRGSIGEECPECGKPHKLRLCAMPPRQGLPAGTVRALVVFFVAAVVSIVAIFLLFELWPGLVQGPYGIWIVLMVATLPGLVMIIYALLLPGSWTRSENSYRPREE